MAVAFSTFFLASICFANSNINGNKIVIAKSSRSRTSNLNKKNFRFVINCKDETLHRSSFPDDFLFGASTSALQIESSARDGGRGESTMDSSLGGGCAAKSLCKYNEDILCLKNMGMDVYRFSISWPRLFPQGKVNEANLNQKGLEYYKSVFKLLKLNNIQPIVSIFHFELPKAIEDKYGGTLSPQFEDDFRLFADFCFTKFGETVKHWITINEPQVWSAFLYPPETDKDTVPATPIGHDLGKEPYIRAFHLLNAHAKVFNLYKTKYKQSQGGMIGMSLNAEWFLPYSSKRADKQAAVRAWDFLTGWFLDPLVHGDYPCSMKHIVKERLLQFTDKQMAAIKGSFDFIGINYYMSHYTKSIDFLPQKSENPTYSTDLHYTSEKKNSKGVPLGPVAEGNDDMPVYPDGLKQILLYLKTEYENPLVYITENGYPQLKYSGKSDFSHGLNDEIRIKYIQDHLNSVLEAKNEGSKVGAYCVWTLLDCMEFGKEDPYSVRFGLNFVDFDSDYSRIPKKSAEWFREFLTISSSPPAPPSEAVISLPTAKGFDELESLQVCNFEEYQDVKMTIISFYSKFVHTLIKWYNYLSFWFATG